MSPKRRFFLVGFAVPLAAFLFVLRGAPHEQTINFVLGDRASDVVDLSVTYEDDEHHAARDATFHFEKNSAPRVVRHEVTLKNGRYDVSVTTNTGAHASLVTRSVSLDGHAVSMDVGATLP